ncbi:MAG: outer membrane lipoprotein carrier protein LolA [Azoarcus sp.]|jgi:hypothetical protein|nr:outer membrane lipoprotein carrier protein LolA [Azoarcus sp.]
MKLSQLLKPAALQAALVMACLGAALPARAAGLLDEVRARLALAPVTKGEFLQTRKLAQIGKPLVSNGRFLVARDVGVIWENVAPFAQTTRLTKNEILQTHGEGTATRLSADKEPVVGVINAILFGTLSGDIEALAQRFDYSGEVTGAAWRLDFTPKDASLARFIRSLSLSGGRDIGRVEITSAAGDVTLIEFRAQVHAGELAGEDRKRFE